MKPSTIRRYRKKYKIFVRLRGIKKYQVMLLGVTLPFVIATAISLKNAAAMSFEFFAVTVVAAAFSVFTANRLPYWLRAVVNVFVGTLVMMPVRYLITWMLPDISNYLGTHLYLMALSGMALLEPAGAFRRRRLRFGMAMKNALKDALVNSAMFAALMLLVALPREYLGNGTLWGQNLPVPVRLSGMLMPFFGFMYAGFLIAFMKFACRGIDAFGARETERSEMRERENYSQVVVRRPR